MNTLKQIETADRVKHQDFQDLDQPQYLTADEMRRKKGGESTSKKMKHFFYDNNTLFATTGL